MCADWLLTKGTRCQASFGGRHAQRQGGKGVPSWRAHCVATLAHKKGREWRSVKGSGMRAAPASNVSSFFQVLWIPSPPSWCKAKSRSEFAQSIGFDGQATCTVSASDLLQRRSESFSGTHFLLPRGHLSMRERGGVARGGEGGPRIDLS